MNKKLTNQEILKKVVEKEGLTFGSCADIINKLNKDNLNKIVQEFFGASGDVDVTYNRKKYVVETTVVDNEVDFGIITKEEYIARYGNERYEEDED